jgi:hypothetical protein
MATGDGARWTGKEQKIAHRLLRQGFLKQDPVNPSSFRLTDDGFVLIEKKFESISEHSY